MPYLTPDTLPLTESCRRLLIPDDPAIIAAVKGAINELSNPANWEQFGSVPPEAIAYRMLLMFEKFAESDCMLGTIQAHAFQTLPENLLPCDGGIYDRDDYPELWQKLNNHASDLIIDVDTFQTPDLRNRFIYGANDPVDILGSGGTTEHTLTTDEMPAHSHTTQPHSHTTQPHAHGYISAVPAVTTGGEIPVPTVSASPAITDVSTVLVDAATVTVDTSGSGLAHNNMPPYLILGYAMVAK